MDTWLTIVRFLPFVSVPVVAFCVYLMVIFHLKTRLHLRSVNRSLEASECYLRHDFTGGEQCRREAWALAERADRLDRFLPPPFRSDR